MRVEYDRIRLTPQQASSLAELINERKTGLQTERTWTQTGGTHLYVKFDGMRDKSLHIARSGNVAEIND
jgi:hypothetical protein